VYAIGLLGDDKRFWVAKYFVQDFGVDALGLLGRKEFLWVAIELADDGINLFLQNGGIVHLLTSRKNKIKKKILFFFRIFLFFYKQKQILSKAIWQLLISEQMVT